ncbi:MAG: GTP cyclohydrolase II [Pycnora praestabilis]|nr:MAG: GTP cyclohydrolase II [Pycnora praestabilis]
MVTEEVLTAINLAYIRKMLHSDNARLCSPPQSHAAEKFDTPPSSHKIILRLDTKDNDDNHLNHQYRQAPWSSPLPYSLKITTTTTTTTHMAELELPSHASPVLAPYNYPHAHDFKDAEPPPTLISPAFTPPSTPGTGTPALQRPAKPIPIDTSLQRTPKLLEKLPVVNCLVRARIPTTQKSEMFLHLYQNNVDDKEHLAIVFGPDIRSRSLDAPRPGETEMDRMIRGAYTGRLYPGRESSRIDPRSTPSSRPSTPLSSSKLTQPHKHQQQRSPTSDPSIIAALPSNANTPLVRIHSECYTGETAWSARCDCGEQLDEAARLMSLPPTPTCPHNGGVIIYLRQEGRGIGLGEKLKAYNLQDLGSDTVEANLLLRHPADARSYGLATAMLVDLGLGGEAGVRLLTNNPDKVRAVEGPGREVVVKERVAMVPLAWRTPGGADGIRSEEVGGYLRTKVSLSLLQSHSLFSDYWFLEWCVFGTNE